jgi:dTDP-4-dehydrorhamnose reductase
MKILILGSRGNLGSQLTRVFIESSEEVFGWDKNNFDLTDSQNFLAKIKELNPEIIINAAAYNAVDKCEIDKNEFAQALKINSEIVGILSEAAEKINALFIHYSTDYVFSGQDLDGYQENAEPSPINKYGLSKFLGEQKLTAKPNLKYYLIRTSKLFGPPGSSLAAKPSFFDLMLKVAAQKNEISVVDEEKSCFTYTPDLALATKKLIADKMPFGIYHLVNSKPATWYEACTELFKLAKITAKIIPISGAELLRPAKRPNCSTLLNTKAAPLRSYQEALQEYLKKIG